MVKKRQDGPPDLCEMMRTQAAFPFRRQQQVRPRKTRMDVLARSGFEDLWTMYSWGAGRSYRAPVNTPIPKETRPEAVRKLEALVRNGVAFTPQEEELLAGVLGLFGQSAKSSGEIARLAKESLGHLEQKISRLLNRLSATAPWTQQHIPKNWKSGASLSPQGATVLQLFSHV